MQDIATAFNELCPTVKNQLVGTAYITSRDLAAYLQKLEGRPWHRWGRSPVHRLAVMLRPLEITTTDKRLSPTSVVNVYNKEEFFQVWERFQ
jgi:hypothetical protein